MLSRTFEARRLYGPEHPASAQALRELVAVCDRAPRTTAWPPPGATRTGLAERFHQRGVLGLVCLREATPADFDSLLRWLDDTPTPASPAAECARFAASIGRRITPIALDAARLANLNHDQPCAETDLEWSALAESLCSEDDGSRPAEAARLAASLVGTDDPEALERLLFLLDRAADRPSAGSASVGAPSLQRFAEALPPPLRASLLDAALRDHQLAARAAAWVPVDELARALGEASRDEAATLDQAVLLLQRLVGLDSLTEAQAAALHDAASHAACLVGDATRRAIASTLELLADRHHDHSTPDAYSASLASSARGAARVADLCSASDLLDDAGLRAHVAQIVANIARDAPHCPLPTPGMLRSVTARLPRLLADGEYEALAAAVRIARQRVARSDDPHAAALLWRVIAPASMGVLLHAAHSTPDAAVALESLGVAMLAPLVPPATSADRPLLIRAMQVAARSNPDALADLLRSVHSTSDALPSAARAMPADDALALLAPALTHPDEAVRLAAYAMVAHARPTGWPPALLRAALADTEPRIRLLAARAAWSSGDPGLALLSEHLLAHPDAIANLRACAPDIGPEALGRIADLLRPHANARTVRAQLRAMQWQARASRWPLVGQWIAAAPRRSAA